MANIAIINTLSVLLDLYGVKHFIIFTDISPKDCCSIIVFDKPARRHHLLGILVFYTSFNRSSFSLDVYQVLFQFCKPSHKGLSAYHRHLLP